MCLRAGVNAFTSLRTQRRYGLRMDGTDSTRPASLTQQADPQQEIPMRHLLFAAVAALPLMSTAAFAGNEQIYEGNAMPVLGASALTETNTEAQFVASPLVTVSRSRTLSNDTAIERETVFTGTPASDGGTAYARN